MAITLLRTKTEVRNEAVACVADSDNCVGRAQKRPMPGILRIYCGNHHDTTVVIPVVTMSFRRSSNIIANVASPINAAMPAMVNGRNHGSSRHNAKLTTVAIRRATHADQASVRIFRNTNTVATANIDGAC